jgi:formate dehydrogenase major subunit
MAAMPGKPEDLNPNRAVYLLPAATQFETSGSARRRTARSSGAKVIEPLWESRTDHMIMYQFARSFAKELVKNYKMQKVKGMDEPETEDILREINRASGPSATPARARAPEGPHANMHVFDVKTLKAKGGIDKETGYELDGDYFGLPWPCYGTPELKHPGSPNLYDTSKHVMDGGGNFRANFGVERDGVAAGRRRLALAGRRHHHRLPEFDHVLLKKLGWWDDLTEAEKKAAEGKNWKTDPSGGIIRVAMKVHGCHPFGNAKARAWSGTSRPDPAAPRAAVRHAPGLVAKYPTHDDKKAFWRLPTLYKTVQDKNMADKVARNSRSS